MDFRDIRKKDLMDNITRQYRLLREYETKRDLSDRPKEIELANNEIGVIGRCLEGYIKQYEEICQDEGLPSPQELRTMWGELRCLTEGQQQIVRKQDETLETIDQARGEILKEIGNSHRSLALTLLSALNEQEMRVVKSIVGEIDSNKLSEHEMSEALKAVQTGYQELDAKSLPLIVRPSDSEEMKRLWNSPDVNVAGKLKLSIPLIPTILSYETELSLTIKQALSAFWERYFKGKQLLL